MKSSKYTIASLKAVVEQLDQDYLPYRALNTIGAKEGEFLFYVYETGGVSGGSCWDSSNPQPYVNTEQDPGFVVLDQLLEKVAPQISFLNYKKLSAMIKTFEHWESEYYGNRTEYRISYITLEDLANFLNSIAA